MKNIYLPLLLSLFTLSSFAQCYELVWSDEFDYSGTPNPDKWSFDIGGHGWGNNEDQYYTDKLSNAQVAGGKLKITAKKENYGGKAYTSARVISKNTGDWLYGKIEVRAKLPTGQGTWPAIWMLPTDWEYGGWPSSGEIDIMEHVGYDQNVVHATVHTEAYHHSIGTQVGKSITEPDVSTAFHTYKLEWTETQIKVSLDDNEYFTFSKHGTYKQWPFDKRFHLLLNIAMGGNWGSVGGPTDDSKLPTTMEIDYVRVYQNTTPELNIKGPEVISKNSQSTFKVLGAIGEVSWTIPEGGKIITGKNTDEITVQWGDVINETTITASIQGQCDVYSTSYSFRVNQGVPSEDILSFSSNDEKGNSNWKIAEGFEETFIIETNDTLTCVSFDIGNPSLNPRINYLFGDIFSLNNHNHFSVNFKFGNGLAPEMLRIDLLDASNNVISGDFFEQSIKQLKDDCNVWQVSYQYDPIQMNLGEVAGFRMYVNYGIFSTPKRGAFQIGSIAFSKNEREQIQLTNDGNCSCIDDVPLSVDRFLSNNAKLCPNPIGEGESLQIIGVIVKSAEIFDTQGRSIKKYQVVIDNKINLPNLRKGVYLLKVNSNKETLKFIRK